MIYQRGKGATAYYDIGFKNFGCLMGVLLFPLQVLLIICKHVLQKTITSDKNVTEKC